MGTLLFADSRKLTLATKPDIANAIGDYLQNLIWLSMRSRNKGARYMPAGIAIRKVAILPCESLD
jgi:hypothetical protein